MAPPAGDRAGLLGWGVVAGLAGVAGFQPLACGPGPEDPAVDLAGVLADAGPKVIEPALATFADRAADLKAATAAWVTDPTRRDAAREAFAEAMVAWQRVEVMGLGPVGDPTAVAGGAGLRATIYAWPDVNPCRVDQEIVAGAWATEDYFQTRLPNAQGLGAIEHLLWSVGPDNTCPSQVAINADGSWDALGEAEIDGRRAAFADALAQAVQLRADAAHAAWRDGYSAALADAGQVAPYGSQNEAIQAIYDALFYLEIQSKDQKLAKPLGLRDCEAPCPDQVELRASGQSVAAIQANLEGFRALFTGGDGRGLDDLLTQVGHPEVAAEVLADVDAAIQVAEGLPLPLDRAIAEDPASAEALHAAVRAVTDDLKGDVATLLLLQIPAEAAGDND